jgi:hypothetical protein
MKEANAQEAKIIAEDPEAETVVEDLEAEITVGGQEAETNEGDQEVETEVTGPGVEIEEIDTELVIAIMTKEATKAEENPQIERKLKKISLRIQKWEMSTRVKS